MHVLCSKYALKFTCSKLFIKKLLGMIPGTSLEGGGGRVTGRVGKGRREGGGCRGKEGWEGKS